MSEFISECRHKVKLLLKSFNRNSNSRTVEQGTANFDAARLSPKLLIKPLRIL